MDGTGSVADEFGVFAENFIARYETPLARAVCDFDERGHQAPPFEARAMATPRRAKSMVFSELRLTDR